MGKNKGKKYVKLRGGEVATPQSEARASAFLKWYGEHERELRERLIYKYRYDDEIATDTMLNIYDAISYKGLIVADPKFYYLRAYHTNYLAAQIKKSGAANVISLDIASNRSNICYDDSGARNMVGGGGVFALIEKIAAPQGDYEQLERDIETLKNEMTEYVRARYDPADCSIFEIYIALQPGMTYKRLAALLGFSAGRVWPVIGAIKKDLKAAFMARTHSLLYVNQ